MKSISGIKSLLFLLFIVGAVPVWSQFSNLRWKTILPQSDTLIVDSLSIYQSSFQVFCAGKRLDKDEYFFNGITRKFLNKTECQDSLELKYRVFSIDFEKPLQTIDTSMIYRDVGEVRDYYFNTKNDKTNFFSDDGIKKSGSISRG